MVLMRVFLTLLACLVSISGLHHGQQNAQHYTNEWVVRIQGGPEVAQLLAEELNYLYLGPVVGFSDTYRVVKSDHPRVYKRAHHRLTQRLVSDGRVVWAEQQFAKQRTKRGVLPVDGSRRLKRADLEVPKRLDIRFNDELWGEEWYLQDTRTRPDLPKLDLHVLPLYELGVTGRGVRVSVLDDGVEYRHDDLKANYDPEISYDANDSDPDPTPRYDESRTNAHGTRCAGEIAMTANNGKCGVGVAFNARIGGVRLLDGEVNDRVEGTALGYAYDKVDIYSASWGPNDDGKTVEGPGTLAMEAIERGISKGRGGKGVIYVWASGNGGSRGDNCNCDGYIASVYTLSVGSASQHGQFPWYGERCAATFATTYSSGAYSDQMIATTDLKNTCTIKHTGTSASAPLAAGIIALALEVNPELTWRDVQHLVMWTSEYAPLSDNAGWTRNAAGAWVNTRFGFGLMNALGLVKAAANWTTVPPKGICATSAQYSGNSTLLPDEPVSVHFLIDGCIESDHEVNYLEHVEVEVNIAYSTRGALEIHLTSAAGTRVQLLEPRKMDLSDEGFASWRFMSVLTWGESPRGLWTLEITGKAGASTDRGLVGKCTLILHGTRMQPAYKVNGPRQYDQDYNRVHKKTASVSMDDPATIDMLREDKGSNQLEWSDLVGVPVVIRQSPGRYSQKIAWLEDVFGL